MRITSSQAEFVSRSHWFTEKSLEESLHIGECLICCNLIHSERQAIHSFLWEGMMSPHVRASFLQGGGFCARHFWIAKLIEDDCWPAGGIGIAILCENLIARAIVELPSAEDLVRSEASGPFRRKREVTVRASAAGCIFCSDWVAREESLIEVLQYLQHKRPWTERLERSPLCVHHILLALRIWKNPADKEELRVTLERRLRELPNELEEFIRKHDWNHRDEPLGREKDSVFRTIQTLTGLRRQFPIQRIGAVRGSDRNASRDGKDLKGADEDYHPF